MPQYFTVREAAVYLHVSASFLNQKRGAAGGPRYHKLGRKVVYASDDLDRWRDERARLSTKPEGGVPPPSRRKRRRLKGDHVGA
jgi:hypothetical protein